MPFKPHPGESPAKLGGAGMAPPHRLNQGAPAGALQEKKMIWTLLSVAIIALFMGGMILAAKGAAA